MSRGKHFPVRSASASLPQTDMKSDFADCLRRTRRNQAQTSTRKLDWDAHDQRIQVVGSHIKH